MAFDNLTTIDSHEEHIATVNYLQRHRRPVVVIAASGMCSGGRIVNYLKAMIGEPHTDVLFAGYQARGTAGHAIQRWGPQGGYDGAKTALRERLTGLLPATTVVIPNK